MEFLDPKKKRQHIIQLYIGYGLMAIVIVLATLIFVYQAKGYDLDRKSGEIVQNGLVFIDSAPQGASIILNGEKRRETTDARLVLKEGQYNLKVEREGYRSWEKSFSLGGGSIERFAYPFLFPNEPSEKIVDRYNAVPGFTSTSPDRHWLVLHDGVSVAGYRIKVYDLQKIEEPSTAITLPSSAFVNFDQTGQLSVVEWSTDNRHVLLQYDAAGSRQFVIFDRANPAQYQNINTIMGISPSKVTLFDKAVEKVYVYDQLNRELRIADLIKKTLNEPIATNVFDYKTHGADTVVYAASLPDTPSQAVIAVRQDDKTYTLRKVPASDAERYVMEVARYDGHWYYVAAAQSEGKIYIYKDPKLLTDGQTQPYLSVMRLEQPMFASFSANARNIAVQSGAELAVYDNETQRQYRFKVGDIDVPQSYKMEWMDGHRLLAVKDGAARVTDFDGSNQQALPIVRALGTSVYFDRNYKTMIAYRAVNDSSQVSLSFYDLLTPEK